MVCMPHAACMFFSCCSVLHLGELLPLPVMMNHAVNSDKSSFKTWEFSLGELWLAIWLYYWRFVHVLICFVVCATRLVLNNIFTSIVTDHKGTTNDVYGNRNLHLQYPLQWLFHTKLCYTETFPIHVVYIIYECTDQWTESSRALPLWTTHFWCTSTYTAHTLGWVRQTAHQ